MLKLIEVLNSEAEYRAHPAWNYSKIKAWLSKNPLGWRKKYILGDNSEDEDNTGIRDGHLIDCKLLGTEEDFESQYFVGEIDKLPTPKEKLFADTLMSKTIDYIDSEGIFQGDFIECCREVYSEIGGVGNSKFETFISKFEGSEIEKYYLQLRKSIGKKVISYNEVESADHTVKVLRTDENTKDLFNGEGLNQLAIVFEYEGVQFKALIDRMKINHQERKIMSFDLKTSYSVDDFGYQYLKLCYFIQQAIYEMATLAYCQEKYPNYEIEGFCFCVIDAKAYYRPLIWNFEFNIGENPWFGFTHRGKNYKGIWEILEEINFHINSNEWRIKKSHLDRQGKITFKIGE